MHFIKSKNIFQWRGNWYCGFGTNQWIYMLCRQKILTVKKSPLMFNSKIYKMFTIIAYSAQLVQLFKLWEACAAWHSHSCLGALLGYAAPSLPRTCGHMHASQAPPLLSSFTHSHLLSSSLCPPCWVIQGLLDHLFLQKSCASTLQNPAGALVASACFVILKLVLAACKEVKTHPQQTHGSTAAKVICASLLMQDMSLVLQTPPCSREACAATRRRVPMLHAWWVQSHQCLAQAHGNHPGQSLSSTDSYAGRKCMLKSCGKV